MNLEIDHPHGRVLVPLAEWIQTGPGTSPLLAPKRLLDESGHDIPLAQLPLHYRNTALSRLLIRTGVLNDPWRIPLRAPKAELMLLTELIQAPPSLRRAWRKKSAHRGLRRLLSVDLDERMEGIYGFLLSEAFHQYTLYPFTPSVMRSVLNILETGEINELQSGTSDGPMAAALLSFLRSCAQRGQQAIQGKPLARAATIEEAALAGRSLYREFLGHEDAQVREQAAALLEWAANQQAPDQAAG